jgi:hypothetical protein
VQLWSNLPTFALMCSIHGSDHHTYISAKSKPAAATASTCSDLLVGVLAAADAAAADDGHPAFRQLIHLPQHIGR